MPDGTVASPGAGSPSRSLTLPDEHQSSKLESSGEELSSAHPQHPCVTPLTSPSSPTHGLSSNLHYPNTSKNLTRLQNLSLKPPAPGHHAAPSEEDL